MIIPGLDTLDCFFVVFTRLGDTFNSMLSRVVLDGILKVECRHSNWAPQSSLGSLAPVAAGVALVLTTTVE